MARMLDKGRAALNGTVGEYHFDCVLDKKLFEFKHLMAKGIRNLLTSGTSDEDIAEWINNHGTPRTDEEIKAWSDMIEALESELLKYLEDDDQVLIRKVRAGSLLFPRKNPIPARREL